MNNKFARWFKTINYPHYIIFFVTARCNASCKMCFYKDNMANRIDNELTIEEYEKIARSIKLINVLGISGGEPFLRDDLSEIVKVLYRSCSPLVVDLPTNGFFVKEIIRQVEDIARYCKDMVIDIQLSIDGPEEIHNQIRGLKDGFKRIKETYNGLIGLKDKYKNLRVKGCIVYSHYNQDYIEDLFKILKNDFNRLDRIVFSVAHGSVSNLEALQFDWDRYFNICNNIGNTATVRNINDLHSIFTIALRMAKNDYLRKVLKTKDLYKNCRAGRRVIVINETGKVFPCEPLWQEVGDLRKNGYNLDDIMNSSQMQAFNDKITRERCTCNWNIPLSSNLIYRPSYYPRILSNMLKVAVRSLINNGKKEIICR